MRIKIQLGMALAAAMLLILASGCASSPEQLGQPSMTSHMKSAVGTPDEMSPLAPPEAKNVRKVGNQWRCEVKGQDMSYNAATSLWEPMKK